MCWHFSTAIGFCNNVEHVGPRWMFKTLHPPLSPSIILLFAINFGYVTNSILDCQTYNFLSNFFEFFM
jgi:hypothetical protein